MRYAVIGAAGQLGRDLVPRLPGEVLPLDRTRADLTQPDLLRQTLTELKPDFIINCAAYNFVDKAETEPDAAFATNAWGVRGLARISHELGSILVHFSSDYVFGLDSARATPFQIDDAPGPVSVYGCSKLAGEYMARAECPRHFVIRTCGLYGVWGSGGKGGNFVETMLRLAGQDKPMRVVADQHCTPSYTADVAAATVALIATPHYGLYHITNSGAATWHAVAQAALELSGSPIRIEPIPSSGYPTPARRPGYSVLAMDALQQAGVAPPRPWREALAAYLEERSKRASR